MEKLSEKYIETIELPGLHVGRLLTMLKHEGVKLLYSPQRNEHLCTVKSGI